MCSSYQCFFLELAWSTCARAGQLGLRPPQARPQWPAQLEEALEGCGIWPTWTHVTRGGPVRGGTRTVRTCVALGGFGEGGAQAQDPLGWKRLCWGSAQAVGTCVAHGGFQGDQCLGLPGTAQPMQALSGGSTQVCWDP